MLFTSIKVGGLLLVIAAGLAHEAGPLPPPDEAQPAVMAAALLFFVYLGFAEIAIWLKRCISPVGGKQKTVDLELEHPVLGERIGVQVKSRASQKVLDDYIQRIEKIGIYDRLFFVCHSPLGEIKAPEGSDVHVWTGREFAATVMKVGLHEWVLEKIA